MGLDQYAYRLDTEVDEIEAQFYWRKHAKLQERMETLFVEKTGKSIDDLNCGKLELNADDVAALKAAIESEGLPQSPGRFFYGHQVQDQQADHYRQYDLKFCDWAESQIKEGETVIYSCWW